MIKIIYLSCFISFFCLPFCFTSTDGNIPLVDNSLACGPDKSALITNSLGFVQSPGFDNFRFYPANKECSWTLQAPAGKVILLKKLFFTMNLNCDHDALEIHDGDHIARYCGYWMPTQYRSSTNKVYLRFFSGRQPYGVGFHLYFEHGFPKVKCRDEEIACRHQTKCVEKANVCDGVDDCSDGTDEENCKFPDAKIECGLPKIKPVLGNDRIVGGRDAIPGSWPWQVSLRRIDIPVYDHMCGGVLISKQWVVTAAHCFKNGLLDTMLWNALLGKHYKLVPDETQQLRYVKSIHIHPEYKGLDANHSVPWVVKKSHDIALVELNSPVNITEVILPVCLPPKGVDIRAGTLCYVTGWGDTHYTGFDLVLKQAAVPVVDRNLCKEWYNKEYRIYPVAKTMLCAGYKEGGHDSCNGDSGGPLVYLGEDGAFKLAGIVSTGGHCADAEQPGIYTAVAPYVDWIEETLRTKKDL